MSKPGVIAGAASLLLLAGCGGGGEASNVQPGANETDAQETAAAFQQRIEGLNEAQRNAVFIRAIRGADRDCQHVERSAPRAPIRGTPAWTAVCRGGFEWIILIRDGGLAQVTHEAELRASGIEPAGGNAQ